MPASKVDIPDETTSTKVMKKTLRTTITELIPEVLIEEEGWPTSIIQKLSHPSSSIIAKELKDFGLENGELYFQGSGGILTRAISKTEAKIELEHVHNLCCRDNDISLYRQLQQRGYY